MKKNLTILMLHLSVNCYGSLEDLSQQLQLLAYEITASEPEALQISRHKDEFYKWREEIESDAHYDEKYVRLTVRNIKDNKVITLPVEVHGDVVYPKDIFASLRSYVTSKKC